MDDEKIIRLYQMRLPEAIAQTEIHYGALCRSLAGKLLPSQEDVNECVNDTYLALWNTIPPAVPSPLSAYIAKVTRNQALKKLEHLSAEKRQNEAALSFTELDGCIPAPTGPEQIYEEKELKQTIIRFLQKQRSASRVIFLRRYFFFDSVQEIAKNYRISESKVKSSLMRTRKRLKAYLIEEGYIL